MPPANVNQNNSVAGPDYHTESFIGLNAFISGNVKGIGGILKKQPQDFIVNEVGLDVPKVDGGEYTIARIRITNWETNTFIRQLSKRLYMSRNRVSFSGTKDKRAITTQLFSFRNLDPGDLMNVSIRGVEILECFTSDRELQMGSHTGNQFDIMLRGTTSSDAKSCVGEVSRIITDAGGFPNFFGPQRFGVLRPITHLCGRHIIHDDFKGAFFEYCGTPIEGPDPSVEARRAVMKEDYSEAIALFGREAHFEKSMVTHIMSSPDDYVGAIDILPLNLKMMLVHAYQSYLFNLSLSERISRGIPINEPAQGDIILSRTSKGLPDHNSAVHVRTSNLGKARRQCLARRAWVSGTLFGNISELPGGIMGEIEQKIIEEEKVEKRDFLIPKIPNLSSKGSRRELLANIDGLEVSPAENESDFRFRFGLNKGCYATSLMREFMKADIFNYG